MLFIDIQVAIASFTTFVLMDRNNVLTPSIAFVSLALFNQLRFPLNQFPRLITFYVMVMKYFNVFNVI